jgi:hypothetical protein
VSKAQEQVNLTNEGNCSWGPRSTAINRACQSIVHWISTMCLLLQAPARIRGSLQVKLLRLSESGRCLQLPPLHLVARSRTSEMTTLPVRRSAHNGDTESYPRYLRRLFRSSKCQTRLRAEQKLVQQTFWFITAPCERKTSGFTPVERPEV